MGGPGGATNPEQLFAIGYAACFEGAIGVAARRERVEAGDVSIDSRVHSSPTPRARLRPRRRARREPAVGRGSRAGGAHRRGRAQGLPVLQRHARQHRRRARPRTAARSADPTRSPGSGITRPPPRTRGGASSASSPCIWARSRGEGGPILERPGPDVGAPSSAGDGHLRRELRHGRQAADRAAQGRRHEQVPADLDRASGGGGDPDEAPGRLDAAPDDARPALRHARRARGRVQRASR